jgi:hypothetical protein
MPKAATAPVPSAVDQTPLDATDITDVNVDQRHEFDDEGGESEELSTEDALLTEFVHCLHGEPKSQRLEHVYTQAIKYLKGEELSETALNFSNHPVNSGAPIKLPSGSGHEVAEANPDVYDETNDQQARASLKARNTAKERGTAAGEGTEVEGETDEDGNLVNANGGTSA